MEVIIPSAPMDFDFGSARSTPYALSTPSTPKRFGEYYFSAPTSPSRMADFYRDLDEFEKAGSVGATGEPLESGEVEEDDQEFAFDFCGGTETASLSAEELFDGGKIRPLKPPPRLQLPAPRSPARSPRSPVRQGRRNVGESSRRSKPEQERGRNRAPGSGSGPRSARSLSPYRVSSYPWEEEEKDRHKANNNPKQATVSSSASKGSVGSGFGSKKWSLKDFLLFRSASEGRATDKDPLRKYSAAIKRQEEGRTRLTEGNAGSISRRRPGPMSAHEMHYTANKAVSEDMKKRTFLPYKQGILARFSFNPTVGLHALANLYR